MSEATMNQFHQERQKIIGGSDAPVVMGLSPYKSPFALYLDKAGLTEPEPEPDNGPLYFGKILEPILMNELSKREGIEEIEAAPPLILHPEFSFLGAHLDGRIPGKPEIIEAKTTNPFKQADWGEPGTDDIPEFYIVQCQHNMNVAEAELCYVPVLVGGSQYATYIVPRNDKLIKAIQEKEIEFWQRIQDQRPPEPDGSDASTEALKKLYPQGTGEVISPTSDIINTLHELKNLKDELAVVEKDKKAAENIIKKFMGDATIMPVDGLIKGRGVQWTNVAGSKKIDYKAFSEHLMKWIVKQGFATQYKMDKLVENDFTKIKRGFRRFICNFEE